MFLHNFMTWAAGDETPENYNAWSALSALGSIVGAKIWMMNGKFTVYPNLYVILLGPPGNAKTTAMKRARRVIDHFKDAIPMSADCQTKESICKDLAALTQTFQIGDVLKSWTPYSMFITELSHLLGANSMHMIDFLTTIYDIAPDNYKAKTKHQGTDEIACPCINLLACTTPEWVTLYLKQDIISGGFTRRAILVNEEWTTKRIPRPMATAEQDRAYAKLIVEAEALHLLKGQMVWHPDAERAYDHWYTTLEIPTDLDTRSFHRCKHNQILKIGILVAAAAHPTDLTFYREDFLTAVELVRTIEGRLSQVFRSMGRNELKTVMDKALQLLNSGPKGEIGEKQFKAALWGAASERERDEVIREMITNEMMYLIERAGRRFYITPERYADLKQATAAVAAAVPPPPHTSVPAVLPTTGQ